MFVMFDLGQQWRTLTWPMMLDYVDVICYQLLWIDRVDTTHCHDLVWHM